MATPTPSSATSGDAALAKNRKLHGRAFYESIGSPKLVLAPMVAQSEFAWRVLTRSFMDPRRRGEILAYSPMFHARLFKEAKQYRNKSFLPIRPRTKDEQAVTNTSSSDQPYLDGRKDVDRPLTVQFCANDPDELLEAAQHVQSYCDAVDLNLGCPQGIAKKGKYGAFLQEDQELIYSLINKLHIHLDIPVTAKIRILDSKEATLAYAQNVLAAGASILTVHGRKRDQKGHNTGLADWPMIRYLRQNLPPDTVLFANGNILRHEDIARCLEATGADAVMSAEGNLHDPTIFAPRPESTLADASLWRSSITSKCGYRVDFVFREYMSVIYKYVLEEQAPIRPPLYDPQKPSTDVPKITNPYGEDEDEDGPPRKKQKKSKKSKKSVDLPPSLNAMQSHLFSLMRPLVAANTEVRDALAKARAGHMAAFEYVLALTEQAVRRGLEDYARDPTKYEDYAVSDSSTAEGTPLDLTDHESSLKALQACKMPWWVCQSYVRPLPREAMENGSMQPNKKQKREMEMENRSPTGDKVERPVDNDVSTPTMSTSMQETKGRSLEANNEKKRKHSANEELPQAATVCG